MNFSLLSSSKQIQHFPNLLMTFNGSSSSSRSRSSQQEGQPGLFKKLSRSFSKFLHGRKQSETGSFTFGREESNGNGNGNGGRGELRASRSHPLFFLGGGKRKEEGPGPPLPPKDNVKTRDVKVQVQAEFDQRQKEGEETFKTSLELHSLYQELLARGDVNKTVARSRSEDLLSSRLPYATSAHSIIDVWTASSASSSPSSFFAPNTTNAFPPTTPILTPILALAPPASYYASPTPTTATFSEDEQDQHPPLSAVSSVYSSIPPPITTPFKRPAGLSYELPEAASAEDLMAYLAQQSKYHKGITLQTPQFPLTIPRKSVKRTPPLRQSGYY